MILMMLINHWVTLDLGHNALLLHGFRLNPLFDNAQPQAHVMPAAAMRLQAGLCRFQSALWQAMLQ
jgi:hypothetical protein